MPHLWEKCWSFEVSFRTKFVVQLLGGRIVTKGDVSKPPVGETALLLLAEILDDGLGSGAGGTRGRAGIVHSFHLFFSVK